MSELSPLPQSTTSSTNQQETINTSNDVSKSDDIKIHKNKVTEEEEDTNTRLTKRQRKIDNDNEKDENDKGILDICKKLDITDGTRLEMKWDINDDNGTKSTHWWGAALQEWDGRVYTVTPEDGEEVDDNTKQEEESKEKEEGIPDKVIVPLRKLKYDAYPSGGYNEPSLVEVCFLSAHALYDLEQKVTVSFRAEGSTWEEEHEEQQDSEQIIPFSSSEEGLRTLLDTVLQSALSNVIKAQNSKNITAAQQCIVAEKVNTAKERLVQSLMKKINQNGETTPVQNVITPDIVKACMQEVALELQTI